MTFNLEKSLQKVKVKFKKFQVQKEKISLNKLSIKPKSKGVRFAMDDDVVVHNIDENDDDLYF